jgi:predicted TPR repeat methyltransferase
MQVDQAVLDAVYTENYFKGEEYLDYLEDQDVQRVNFLDRTNTYKKVSGTAPKQILEIGCAYGLFGDVARKVWPESHYVGYDVVGEAIDHAQITLNLDARNQDYLTAAPEQKSDAIFMWDVIEHLQHPDKFIEKIATECTDGAYLSITTGDISAMLPRFQKRSWRMIHPPSHLHYFSRKTITELLESKGFDVVHCSYPAIKRSARLIYFGLFMLNKQAPNWVKKLHNAIPSRWAIGINTFDIMFIIARKRNGAG